MANSKYDQLSKLLVQLFQMDQADLDFGIYRIMNAKRKEVDTFINQDLQPQIQKEFSKYQSEDREKLQKQITELTKSLQDAGVNPEASPKYQQLVTQKTNVIDVASLENLVYTDLFEFFNRYYDNGDFISMRRYKDGVYAIPYEGEEVKLYWANHDQYYIKTTEYFTNFSFKLPNGRSVTFFIAEADTEQNNNKEQKGKERKFIYQPDKSKVDGNDLKLAFIYESDPEKQEKHISDAVASILTTYAVDDFNEIATKAPTEKDNSRTVLEKRLKEYTDRNTFDYFIHKDLGKFLRRELDFYIKNEILRLDDLDTDNELAYNTYMSRIRVFKRIAGKIIDFLAQIENFQKKMWEKKKFVVESNYCMSIGKLDEKFYADIAKSKEQKTEWMNLGMVEKDTDLTVAYLKSHPTLVMDTKFFVDRKWEILATIENLDENTDGLLIHSENWQALNSIQQKYAEKVDSIYIDPPYNTNSSEILYKNSYKHSSWLSLINDRLQLSRNALIRSGCSVVAIDDLEVSKLLEVLNNIYDQDNNLGIVAVRNNPKGRMSVRKVSLTHEYLLFYGNWPIASIQKLPVLPEEKTHNYKKDADGTWYLPVNLRKQGVDSEGERNGKLLDRHFPIYYDPSSKIISTKKTYSSVIYPIDSEGKKRIWRRGIDAIDEMYTKKDLWIQDTVNGPQLYFKFRGGLDGKLVQSLWVDPKYSASEYGTLVLDNILGTRETFSYPKSPYAVMDALKSIELSLNGIILDFFAGSGTTGHAVIKLNKEDKDRGRRKFILVEMGEYFETVLKPRILKVMYTAEWKTGKPDGDVDGYQGIVKYFSLESYEDTLNNLETGLSTEQLGLLKSSDTSSEFREEYLLKYMLDFEAAQSASLLNLPEIKDPFAFKLNITRHNEIAPRNIDLVESFNYLIGLWVHSVNPFTKNGYLILEGKLRTGERTLVIWRTLSENAAADNTKLNDFLSNKEFNPRNGEYDLIFVNGDNMIENLKKDGEEETQMWKVRRIEAEIRDRQFTH